MSAATCLTCTHWAPKRAEKMARHGYGCCALSSVWKFFSPSHTCPKHKPAADHVVAARTTWLAKINKTGVTA